jgi:hypothetical protein
MIIVQNRWPTISYSATCIAAILNATLLLAKVRALSYLSLPHVSVLYIGLG